MVRVLVTSGAQDKFYAYLERYYGLKGLGEWIEHEMEEGHKAEDIVGLFVYRYTPYFLFEFHSERNSIPGDGEYYIHEKSMEMAREAAQMQVDGKIHLMANVKMGDFLITEEVMEQWISEELGKAPHNDKYVPEFRNSSEIPNV